MYPPLKIAWRYFRAKKTAQAINIISWISIVAISIASGAMIVLFSVFNGLENWVKERYVSFYPEIKVQALKGKFFEVSSSQLRALKQTKGVAEVAATAQDMVLLNTEDQQRVATLKGVDNNWFKVCDLQTFMVDNARAQWPATSAQVPAIAGLGLTNDLGIDVKNVFSTLKVQYPKPGTEVSELNNDAFNTIMVKPESNFENIVDFDREFILVPLAAAQHLLGIQGRISALEIKKDASVSDKDIKQNIQKILGSQVKVESRFEQNKTLYMVMQGEKWAVFFILTFVLLIASFNMIGSLSMVVMEKREDIAILKSMGATSSFIQRIFLFEGTILALLGALIGVGLGVLLCMGQQQFGFVKLSDAFAVSSYPVDIYISDIALVFVTVGVIGCLASVYPALKAGAQAVFLREQ